MNLSAEQLMEIKQIEMELFKSFISVCQKLNLKYYLIGGTLLGAVRHKGFIPWDDDIDVGMLREDYEIFLEKGQALLPEGYFLQCGKSDPEYLNCFAKIRNSNTTYLETSVRNRKINHGVFIDIFPLDFYPDNEKKQKLLLLKKKVLNSRISLLYYNERKNKSFKIKLIEAIIKFLYPSCRMAVKDRDKLYKSVKNGSFVANHGGAWGIKEIVPVEWYGEGIFLEFEGLTVRAPIEYDKWLTQVYGDYMQLPPEEKRCPHHYVDVIDFKKSYREYISEDKK